MLCWFLPYNNVNPPWVYLGPLPLEPPSHPRRILLRKAAQADKLNHPPKKAYQLQYNVFWIVSPIKDSPNF